MEEREILAWSRLPSQETSRQLGLGHMGPKQMLGRRGILLGKGDQGVGGEPPEEVVAAEIADEVMRHLWGRLCTKVRRASTVIDYCAMLRLYRGLIPPLPISLLFMADYWSLAIHVRTRA